MENGDGTMRDVPMTKEEKLARFKRLNETSKKGETVFAGSSLMEMFPIERFIREEGLNAIVYNRGVGGFVTEELLENIDTCILDLKPSRLFINIGTNDLSDPARTVPQIMANYGQILERVRAALPKIEITLMAYYPINYEAATEEMKPCLAIRTNEKLRQANRAAVALAAEHEARFIDLNAPLTDDKGNLKAEYTIEGMHINEQGYRAVYPLLRAYILE